MREKLVFNFSEYCLLGRVISPRKNRKFPSYVVTNRRLFSFSFAGPKNLNDILKKDLVKDKTKSEISDLWYTYHENKENVIGLVLEGKEKSNNLLSRASSNHFFVQPIFRDGGHFMLVSQFFEPSHFIMAYLEDYKIDPSAAQPLLTFSVFNDYANEKELALIRADVLNKGINDGEAQKVVTSMLDSYTNDEEFLRVKAFNSKPELFDLDDYLERKKEKWENEDVSIVS